MILQTEPVPADLEPGLVSQDGVDASAQRVDASDPSAATRNPGRLARAERPVRRVPRDVGGSTLGSMTNASGDLVNGGPALREAAARLAHLGFLVVGGSHPEETGSAQLLVALRSRPTLEHFDADVVEHWVTSAGRGRLAEITRATPTPHTEPFAWGTIRAVDRVEVFNSFLAFGGDVTVAVVDPDTTIVVFDSPAPIVRSTGHSQSVDPLTGEVGAFFARMKVPIDFQDGAEQRIAAMAPRALYGAMLAAIQRRYAQREALRVAHPAVAAWAGREAHRMREEHRPDWDAGEALTTDLGLDRD
jgi:hypothetical protein